MTHSTMQVNTTARAKVKGLADDNGVFQNDATVTIEDFRDRETGALVTGITLPLTLAYVAASNGDYEGTILHTIAVTVNRWYIVTFKAVGTQAYEKEWEETVKVEFARA